jgi:hypothetical protein
MFRKQQKVLIRPELDDRELHRAISAIQPAQQMQGLGTERSGASWAPVAAILRDTGRD